jgi:hypothetical protein
MAGRQAGCHIFNEAQIYTIPNKRNTTSMTAMTIKV